LANAVDVAAGREVHHCVGAEVNSGVQLVELFVDFAGDGGVADVGVDFARGGHADGHGFQALLQMHGVRRDHHTTASNLVADKVGSKLLALGHVAHGVGDRSFSCSFNLRHEENL